MGTIETTKSSVKGIVAGIAGLTVLVLFVLAIAVSFIQPAPAHAESLLQSLPAKGTLADVPRATQQRMFELTSALGAVTACEAVHDYPTDAFTNAIGAGLTKRNADVGADSAERALHGLAIQVYMAASNYGVYLAFPPAGDAPPFADMKELLAAASIHPIREDKKECDAALAVIFSELRAGGILEGLTVPRIEGMEDASDIGKR